MGTTGFLTLAHATHIHQRPYPARRREPHQGSPTFTHVTTPRPAPGPYAGIDANARPSRRQKTSNNAGFDANHHTHPVATLNAKPRLYQS